MRYLWRLTTSFEIMDGGRCSGRPREGSEEGEDLRRDERIADHVRRAEWRAVGIWMVDLEKCAWSVSCSRGQRRRKKLFKLETAQNTTGVNSLTSSLARRLST